jgi:hypothetical protein
MPQEGQERRTGSKRQEKAGLHGTYTILERDKSRATERRSVPLTAGAAETISRPAATGEHAATTRETTAMRHDVSHMQHARNILSAGTWTGSRLQSRVATNTPMAFTAEIDINIDAAVGGMPSAAPRSSSVYCTNQQ